MVGIVFKHSNVTARLCSGSLISSNSVITAGHCLRELQTCKKKYTVIDDIYVCHGSSWCPPDAKNAYSVKSVFDDIYVKSDYPCKNENDIAVITLSRIVEDSLPICLLFDDNMKYVFFPNTDIHIAGFSPNTLAKRSPPSDLRITNAGKRIQCGQFEDKYLCTKAATCEGDSGGAMMELHEGRHMLIGVVSFAWETKCYNPDIIHTTKDSFTAGSEIYPHLKAIAQHVWHVNI